MFHKPLMQISVMRSIHAAIRIGRLLRVYAFEVLCAVFLLGAAGVQAQEPATSLDQLNLLMGTGDKITLVESSGNKIKGKVNRLAPDGLDLNVSGHVQTFQGKDIRQITRTKPDSVLNGFLIGAAIGFGATLPINLSYANNEGESKRIAVAASAIWGLVGGGIGALVDASIQEKQLVYFRPKSSVSWSISPFYSDLPYKYQQPVAHALMSDLPSYSCFRSSKGLRLTVRF